MENTIALKTETAPAFGATYSNYIHYFKKAYDIFSIETVKAYLGQLQDRGYSPSTICLAKSALKAYALQHTDTLQGRAALDTAFKTIKTTKPERVIHSEKFLTDLQVRELLDKKKSARKNALIKLLLNTGLRISEALGIKIDDCRLEGETVFINVVGKRKKARRILINKKLFDEIRNAYQGAAWLFENTGGKGPISRQYAHRIVKGSAARVGLKAHPHTFRHTFATRLLNRGKDIQKISAYLGHSTAAITADFYCHAELTIADINELN